MQVFKEELLITSHLPSGVKDRGVDGEQSVKPTEAHLTFCEVHV